MSDVLEIYSDRNALMAGAARRVQQDLDSRTSASRLVLSGGSTPGELFDRLAAHWSPAWSRIRVTFADERAVPPDHERSNYALARARLLEPLGVEDAAVLRFKGEAPAETAAAQAHRELTVWAQRTPLFDLVLLGLGDDGHVASLFPGGSDPDDFGARWAAPARHPSGEPRITLTPRALRSTRQTLFLIAGAGKAEAVREAWSGEPGPRHPARWATAGVPRVVWMLDREAAGELPAEVRAAADNP